MDIIYLLKMFNWFFILTGNGSVNLIERQWMQIGHVWRFVLTSTFIFNAYNGNKWALNNVSNFLEITSIIFIAVIELMLLAPIVSLTWRLYFDNELSIMLKKFSDTLVLLKKLNTEVKLKMTIFWICIVSLVFHFMAYITSSIGYLIANQDFQFFEWVLWSLSFIYNHFSFYEYIFLIIFVQIIVYKLNDELSKGIIPISELSHMYTSTMDSLDVLNKTIAGAPIIINIIFGNVSIIMFMIYNYVLFKGIFVKVDTHRFFPILEVSMRLFDIAILFYLCQTTEKEIRRTTLILNKRSLTANVSLRRKIAFFSLRRLHADFHFELCGFYKINLNQLLSLLFKTIIFLTIQIQFNIKPIYQEFNKN